MTSVPIIESPQNPLIKSLQRFKQSSARQDEGKVLIESLHPLQEALRAGLLPEFVFVREDVADKMLQQLPMLTIAPTLLSERAMAKLATTASPPEVLAVADRPTPCDKYPSSEATVLGLCALQDPGNMGTLIRSARALGVATIALFGHAVGCGVDPFHPKVIRATAGQVFHMRFWHAASFESLPGDVAIIAMDARASQSFLHYEWPNKALILLGQEGKGLPTEVPSRAIKLSIPMVEGVESLNVAVAGSLVLGQRYWGNL